MDRRTFIRLAGGGVVLAATGCASDLPSEALAPWRGPAGDHPDVRRWIVSYALLAPHSHNLQSWLVDLRRPGEITLHCDLQRLLPETDPLSRQILLSQGTFLEVLALAARERGLRPEVVLFPEGEFGPERPDTRPVARVRLVPDPGIAPDPLFRQVLQRRTNREAYAPAAPQPQALAAIAAACAAPGLRCGFTGGSPAELQRHRAIAAAAWRIELETPRTVLESIRLLRVGPAQIARHRDGISVNEPLLRALDAVGLLDRENAPAPDSSITRRQVADFEALLAATPAFFWLVSEGNGRSMQVQSGRAYVRAQLAATAHGLSMHPLSQALQEYPEQARPYADVHALLQATGAGATVQMWTRLGEGPRIGPAPRRGLQAHLLPA